ILRFARIQNDIWPVEPLRTLNYFPINHVGSIVDLSVPCLVAGGTLVFMEAFDATHAVTVVEQRQLTFAMSVPSAYQMQMATAEFSRADWSSLQLLVWEGAALPVDSLQAML